MREILDKVKIILTFETMEQVIEKSLKIDQTKLITQSKYAQKKGMSKQLVQAHIKSGKLKTVEIEGATLILQS